MKEKLIIIGAGPHSKVILDILIEANQYDICGLLDSVTDSHVLGIPVIGTDERLRECFDSGIHFAFVAIGNNKIRRKLIKHLNAMGFKLINAISLHAIVSNFATLGSGIAIMPGAVINAGAKIGDGVILNTNCSVDHDCSIGAYSHIAPGSAISGSTEIGAECFLGTGCCVIDKIKIGDQSVVGAGSVVIRDIPAHCTAVGTPAKTIKR